MLKEMCFLCSVSFTFVAAFRLPLRLLLFHMASYAHLRQQPRFVWGADKCDSHSNCQGTQSDPSKCNEWLFTSLLPLGAGVGSCWMPLQCIYIDIIGLQWRPGEYFNLLHTEMIKFPIMVRKTLKCDEGIAMYAIYVYVYVSHNMFTIDKDNLKALIVFWFFSHQSMKVIWNSQSSGDHWTLFRDKSSTYYIH